MRAEACGFRYDDDRLQHITYNERKEASLAIQSCFASPGMSPGTSTVARGQLVGCARFVQCDHALDGRTMGIVVSLGYARCPVSGTVHSVRRERVGE